MRNLRNFWAATLMLAGLGLIATSLWFGLQPKPVVPNIQQRQLNERPERSLFLAQQHDWWIHVKRNDAERFYQQPALGLLLGEPVQRALQRLQPVAVSFSPTLIVWQVDQQHSQGSLHALSDLYPALTAHVEPVDGGHLMIWFQHDQRDVVIDRLVAPLDTQGEMHSRWLNRELGWQQLPCEPLASLLSQLHPIASLYWHNEGADARWQFNWPVLDERLQARLSALQAPGGSHHADDSWFVREANLRGMIDDEQCRQASADIAGMVQRHWQQDGTEHQAAILYGTPQGRSALAERLPLPLKRQDDKSQRMALASSEPALQWALAHQYAPEQGLLQELFRQSPQWAVYSRLHFDGQLHLQVQFHSPDHTTEISP